MSYLFSWTSPAPRGRQMGAMLLLKLTSVTRVMLVNALLVLMDSACSQRQTDGSYGAAEAHICCQSDDGKVILFCFVVVAGMTHKGGRHIADNVAHF